MGNERWNADKNTLFINEYRRNECLWDPKHPQYKNRNAREAAYKSIMDVMEMENVKDVIGKIRTLRNTYNNETLKAKKKNSAAMTTEELYVTKIPWLRHMDFLKNIDGCTKDNTENSTQNATEDSDSESNSVEFTVPPTSTGKRYKRKVKHLQNSSDVLEKKSPRHGCDEFDLFGQTVAEQLRQVPLEVALETEEMILATIRKQRVNVLTMLRASLRDPLASISEDIGFNRISNLTTPEEQHASESASTTKLEYDSITDGIDIKDEYLSG